MHFAKGRADVADFLQDRAKGDIGGDGIDEGGIDQGKAVSDEGTKVRRKLGRQPLGMPEQANDSFRVIIEDLRIGCEQFVSP